jgi:hypothetical protein
MNSTIFFIVFISFGFNRYEKMLVYFGIALTNRVYREALKINNLYATRTRGKVSAIAIVPNMFLESISLT